MIFKWLDGTAVVLQAGANVSGLLRNGKRPVSVELTWNDLQFAVKRPHYIHYIRGALAVEKPCENTKVSGSN